MNFIDIILGIILLYGIIRGFRKGILMEVASLVALIAGIYGAIHFSHFATARLGQYFSLQPQYMEWLGYAVTFILIVLVIILVGKLLTKFLKLIALSFFNRVLGGIFGLIKVAFLCSVLLMFLHSFNLKNPLIPEQTTQESVIYQYIEPIAPFLLPKILEQSEDIGVDIPLEGVKTDSIRVREVR